MTRNRVEIHFTIDGQAFVTADDDQEAAALLRRASRDPAKFDLARVDAEGDEQFFTDSDIVRLHGGDQFATRAVLHFTIDGRPYRTRDDDQEVADLLRLAGLDPAHNDLARVGDPCPLDPAALVNIHEGDRFVTARRHHPVA
ncbi:hypothetical protein F0Q45_11070 [Mycobacterium simiae]|uniref:Multi-ubiquitin domain-containing protein n=1 Tax=Mycobacterium simiae TaxID=1784 RepID=A0A5B1BSF0_MYCSI|nr:hypothetical protein [Mycobacterium simiae]KAA1250174.1 hypothetical protein F0Q45_11070 [Mycobacterium simiae]